MGTIASLLVFLSVGGPAVALKQASLRHEAEAASERGNRTCAVSEERSGTLEETARRSGGEKSLLQLHRNGKSEMAER